MTMRVLFWGTPRFSIPSLDRLHNSDEHLVISVITQPDKPRGRGRNTSPSPAKVRSLDLSLPVLQPVSTKNESFVEQIHSLEPDVSVVVAYGRLLHRQILDIPKHGSLCLHPSLLPLYRGAAPIQRALMDGVKETGVSLFLMDEGMDTGPVLLERTLPVDSSDTLDTLSARLSLECADVLLDGLELVAGGEAEFQAQVGSATIARKVSQEDARIDWDADAQSIERLTRALDSKPGAYTSLGGRMLKIYRARLMSGEYSALPGTVVEILPDAIVIATGSSLLAIEELQVQGRKRMDAASFLRGNRIELGTRFE